MSAPAVARVVPDLPSFSVDAGFEYAIPPELVDTVHVGSLVRVPLSGRKVRGFVVDTGPGATDGLKDISLVSGAAPVFDRRLLSTIRWAAQHYVAPLSVVAGKCAPPNLPRQVAPLQLPSIPPAGSVAPELTAAAAAGRKLPAVQVLAGTGWPEVVRGLITEPLRANRSALVIAPTVAEAETLANALAGDLGRRVVAVLDDSDAVITTAWGRAAAQPGLVVVGTPRCVWWPVVALAMAVVVDGGRRAMKERQTPAVSAPAILAARARVERFNLAHLGRVPTAETLAEGVGVVRVPGRLWPLVEVVDRTEEPPGGGVVSQRARQAVAGAVRAGERVFVFTHRHGYAPASRCTNCRTLRRCASCGARPDPGTHCRRCNAALGPCAECGGGRFEPLGAAVGRVLEELRRVVGRSVGDATAGAQVVVGTERDLTGAHGVGLAVAVDADGLTHGTNYRAGEDALAVLARLASLVVPGRGRRLLIQTADPGHAVFEALRRGDPLPYLQAEIDQRAALQLPPIGDVLVLEVSGQVDVEEVAEALRGPAVFGPAVQGERTRWLVQGADLGDVRTRLRPVVARIRDRGGRVRIDVDPRDL